MNPQASPVSSAIEPVVRVGPLTLLELTPGTRPLNFWTYMYASFVVIGMLAALNVLQSYLLVEHLRIPRSAHGTLTGELAFLQEIIVLLLINPFGMIADRVGRRPVMIFGVLVLALTYALFPFAATTAQLLLFRAISGVAAAALGGVIAVVANDYPAETSRGRLHGYAGVMNGLGVLFMSVVVAQIPALLRPQGVTAVQAGQVMFLTVATLGVISALIFRAGLKPGTGTSAHQRADWRRLLTSGIRAARNPRIVLAYACAFTGRSDTAIKGTFISLWAVSVAPDAGMTTAEALARAGMIIGIMGVVALPWMPLFGHLLDRINRVTGVAIAMGLAGVGFSSMYFVTSPLDFAMIPAFVLLSIGQLSAISASITLVGQEAPAAERGGVIAMSGWFGALGILLAAVVGGRLFDSWGPFAPFVLAGVVQLAFCAYAVVLRIVAPGPMPAAVTA